MNKIEAYSHQEFDQPEFKNPEPIIGQVRNGIGLFDRGSPYEKIPQERTAHAGLSIET